MTLGQLAVYPEEQGDITFNIDAFSLSTTEVTNSEFAEFVSNTQYITRAERGIEYHLAPELPSKFRKPGGMVFMPFTKNNHQNNRRSLWEFTPGANWRHPYGPDSSIEGLENHPVVQITLEDALAYSKWAKRRLPTEAEWEYAATNAGQTASITRTKPPKSANVWQGEFPFENKLSDGFKRTSPVGCFEPTKMGLYDMLGNVWEITNSVYYPNHNLSTRTKFNINKQYESQNLVRMSVLKGGSHLCAENFCAKYRPESRQPHDPLLGTSHVGFRTAAIN